MNSLKNLLLESKVIFIALFVTQLIAIVSQASLRSNIFELLLQLLFWGLVLGFSVAFSWSALQKKNKSSFALGEKFTNVSAMIGLMAFLYYMLGGNLTAGLLMMMSWLLVGLSFSLQRQRNLYFILLASTILLLYSASLNKNSSFIVYMVLFTIAALTILSANFYLSKTKQQVSQTSIKNNYPFKLPITLLVGVILTVTSAIYLFVPRPQAMNIGSFPAGGGKYYADDDWLKDEKPEGLKDSKTKQSESDQGQNDSNNQTADEQDSDSYENSDQSDQQTSDSDKFSYPGFRDELAIDKKSSPSVANQLILYMKGDKPQYLRGNVYDYFDGESWKRSNRQKTRIERQQNVFKINESLTGPFDQYTITMAADIVDSASIFTPPSTAEMQFPANVIGIDNDGTIFSKNTISKGTFYSVNIPQSEISSNPRPVDKAFDLSQIESKRYLQLPKSLSPKFKEFSEKISAGSTSNGEKAGKIEDYLRKNYEYSFESIFQSQGVIPLEDFLFNKPEGHCEFFATAMVTLMRAQEIPARLVTGFSVTKFNPITGYYEAYGLDAHAWAEVWVPNEGWVTYEATPAYQLPQPSDSENTSQSIEEYLAEKAKDSELSEPTSITTLLLNTAKIAFQQFNILIDKAWTAIKQAISWSGTMLLHYGWLVLLLLLAAYSIIHYLRYYIAHYRINKSLAKAKQLTPEKQLAVSYEAMGKIFGLYNHSREEAWTIQQYQNELINHYPSLNDEITQISGCVNTVLYDQNSKEEMADPVTLAIKNTQKIAKHKFTIPKPAEKQIAALKEFLRTFNFKKSKYLTPSE